MKAMSRAQPFVLCVLASVWITCVAAAQAGKTGASNQPEEKFKAVDPYTKADNDLVRQAGYVSLRPFALTPTILSQDMLEVLGGIDLLWAETAHFKICSSLQTYKSKADSRENDALEKELVELAKRIPGVKAARVSKLDPWIRLHLYAMRLEKLYAEFCARTGFKDSDFPAAAGPNEMGNGPFLGMRLKPVVLLAEKRSALGRFDLHYAKVEESGSHRFTLEGGAMFFGISAESLSENGYEFDIALHCALAEGVVCNLLDGLRDCHWATPLWFDLGLGHWFSRRIDERFTYYASGTTRFLDDNLHEWQPRVRGLVENKFAYPWREMLGTLDWPQLTPQAHMLCWSRVDWMLQQKEANLRAFLMPVSVLLVTAPKDELTKTQVARATAGLAAGFGRTPEECEAAWSAWVLKTYARK